MRSWLLVCGILVTTSSAPCLAQHVGWQSSYETATGAAEKANVPVLLHFHAWYCGPCQRMERDVFPDAEVRKALADGLTAVQIDVSHEPELASQFGASTVPRDVVVFPNGETETLNVGYMSRASYLALLRTTAKRGESKRRPEPKPIEDEQPVPKPVEPSTGNPQPGETGSNDQKTEGQTTNGQNVTSSDTSADQKTAESPIVGLEGYCPVSLHDDRTWIAGKDTIVTEYRDIRYQFASESARDKFLKNPAEYAPQDLGCDPIVLTSGGKAVTGSIRFGAFFDQRLYLFKSAENRDQFKQSPLKYIQIRSALKADQIEGTRFQ